MSPDNPLVLDYSRRRPTRAAHVFSAAAVGAIVGGASAWLSLEVLARGGPIVPLMLLLSPLSLLAEATDAPDWLFRPVVAVGGPILYALYAVLLVRPPRNRGAMIVVATHVFCLLGSTILK